MKKFDVSKANPLIIQCKKAGNAREYVTDKGCVCWKEEKVKLSIISEDRIM